MDIITLSLQRFLDEAEIPYTTTGGASEGESTFTHIEVEDQQGNIADLSFNIFPSDGHFIIEGEPRYVFDIQYLEKVNALAHKWNRTGTLGTLIVKEETGVIEPDSYTFTLMIRAISESIGQSEELWDKYFRATYESTWEAWSQIDAIIDSLNNKD